MNYSSSISRFEFESIESVHIDNSDESRAPEVSLPAVVALSKSVSAGDAASAFALDDFSFVVTRDSLLAFGGT